jgi:pectate lyase-like protein
MPSTKRGPFNAGAAPTYNYAPWLTDLDDAAFRFSNDVFNVKDRDYGAVGDGSANDATAVQAASTAAASVGGIVFFPPGTYKVNSQITIAANVSFVGAGRQVSTIKAGANGVTPLHVNSSTNYASVRGLTIDGNKAGITGTSHGVEILGDLASVLDCRIVNVRNNGVDVQGGDHAHIAGCDFVTIDGSAVRGIQASHDILIEKNRVFSCHNGFWMWDEGLGASFYNNRPRIFDNYIEFTTGTNGTLGQDGGIALNCCPWPEVRGNVIRNNNGRGIHVFGNSPGAIIVGNTVVDCGVTNQVSGIDCGDTGDYNFLVANNEIWRSGASGIIGAPFLRSVISNNVCVANGQGSSDPGNRNGITNIGTASLPGHDNVYSGNVCFDTAGSPTQEYGIREWTGTAAEYLSNTFIGNNCRTNKTGGMLLVGTSGRFANNITSDSVSIASAATITLGPHADVFTVTGTTTITSVAASYAGRRVTLIFSGALTFTDGSNLKLNGNFVTTADDTITLACDGTNWFEVSRCPN